MIKLRIYTDHNLSYEVIENTLFEGNQYYLDLAEYDSTHCKLDFEKSGLINYLDWHPKNKIAILKLINVVGLIQILGQVFDVRSKKLHVAESGENQFQILLKEIDQIAKGINFDYSGLAFSSRQVDELDLNPTTLERFEYYRQLVNEFPTQERLDTLISFVLKNPHSKFQHSTLKSDISIVKKPTINFSKNIRSRDLVYLKEKSDLKDTALAKALLSFSGKNLFLSTIETETKNVSFNTLENQFIKFLLSDIINICIRVIISKGVPKKIKDEAAKIKAHVSTYINNPFFKNISILKFFPNSSSVLIGRAGYRELYFHYIQSRFGFFNLLEDINKRSLKSGLKDIASLYEIWVFFKIAKICFHEEASIINQKRIFKDNNVSWGFTWANDKIELSYNTSYSLQRHSSYSLRLRPDVTLKINNNLYFFDAKYKVEFVLDTFSNDMSTFKQENIHKMHCYLDAINRAKASFVVYPGSKFSFYQKYIYNNISSSSSLYFPNGVGAIPLNTNGDSKDLSNVINAILRDDIETV